MKWFRVWLIALIVTAGSPLVCAEYEQNIEFMNKFLKESIQEWDSKNPKISLMNKVITPDNIALMATALDSYFFWLSQQNIDIYRPQQQVVISYFVTMLGEAQQPNRSIRAYPLSIRFWGQIISEMHPVLTALAAGMPQPFAPAALLPPAIITPMQATASVPAPVFLHAPAVTQTYIPTQAPETASQAGSESDISEILGNISTHNRKLQIKLSKAGTKYSKLKEMMRLNEEDHLKRERDLIQQLDDAISQLDHGKVTSTNKDADNKKLKNRIRKLQERIASREKQVEKLTLERNEQAVLLKKKTAQSSTGDKKRADAYAAAERRKREQQIKTGIVEALNAPITSGDYLGDPDDVARKGEPRPAPTIPKNNHGKNPPHHAAGIGGAAAGMRRGRPHLRKNPFRKIAYHYQKPVIITAGVMMAMAASYVYRNDIYGWFQKWYAAESPKVKCSKLKHPLIYQLCENTPKESKARFMLVWRAWDKHLKNNALDTVIEVKMDETPIALRSDALDDYYRAHISGLLPLQYFVIKHQNLNEFDQYIFFLIENRVLRFLNNKTNMGNFITDLTRTLRQCGILNRGNHDIEDAKLYYAGCQQFFLPGREVIGLDQHKKILFAKMSALNIEMVLKGSKKHFFRKEPYVIPSIAFVFDRNKEIVGGAEILSKWSPSQYTQNSNIQHEKLMNEKDKHYKWITIRGLKANQEYVFLPYDIADSRLTDELTTMEEPGRVFNTKLRTNSSGALTFKRPSGNLHMEEYNESEEHPINLRTSMVVGSALFPKSWNDFVDGSYYFQYHSQKILFHHALLGPDNLTSVLLILHSEPNLWNFTRGSLKALDPQMVQ